MTMPNLTPIAHSLLAQIKRIAQVFTPSPVVQLHVPARAPTGQPHDAEFCAIELADGGFGLSYVLLGDTLQALVAQHGSRASAPLAGADPLVLAHRLVDGSAVERALALAAINALTDSVWRQVGYQPPPAGNSLGDIELGPHDHLGMIGFFPPLVQRVTEAGGRLSVVEMNGAMVARQRERFPGLSISLDRSTLEDCNLVVGTSTMLLNDTLDDMLTAAPRAEHFAVIGPSAGLWPDALFERGVTLLGGTRVIDPSAFREAMASGASWSAAAAKFAIGRRDWPGWRALTGIGASAA
ncbi:DUF364 domain-containing protein [Hydrogenophaga sp.]|uniref:Rossmann-like domain-containing protein n=1 Tax=Hydrogenophaga sp. TaxID=1904254 RepID=UPI0025BD4EDD|nr:DUF364 domain-containing protein [Hydrogenophaga sp.]